MSLIGSSGMGEVYRARDTRLSRDVAIKVLPSEVATDHDRLARFEREAQVLASLNHPNIAQIHGVDDSSGTPALVMELVEGSTLADRIAKGPIPLDEGLRIAIQVADALAAAHRAGIIHRDLKPGNVMLIKAGGVTQAKLLDFGLAKTTETSGVTPGLSMLPTAPPNLTAQGTILGTLQYMAPEQLEGRDADARSDIFAFGVVMYELLTGKKAFVGQSHASLMAAILERDPAPMSTLVPLISPLLDHVVKRCLAKDPDERWQSAGDVKRELQWIAEGGARTVGPMPAVVRRHVPEYVAWGLATLATVLAIGAIRYGRALRQAGAIVRFAVAPPHGAVRRAQTAFAVAPDGQILAFIARATDGVARIFVRRVDAAEAQALASTDGATALFCTTCAMRPARDGSKPACRYTTSKRSWAMRTSARPTPT